MDEGQRLFASPSFSGGGRNPSPEEYLLRILEKLEKNLEKLEERMGV